MMPADMNEDGLIAGYGKRADGRPVPFLWVDGQLVDLGAVLGSGPDPDARAFGEGLNENGQYVGSYVEDNDTPGRPFIWNDADGDHVIDSGEVTLLPSHASLTEPAAINSAGHICGTGTHDNWTHDGFHHDGGGYTTLSPFGSEGLGGVENRRLSD